MRPSTWPVTEPCNSSWCTATTSIVPWPAQTPSATHPYSADVDSDGSDCSKLSPVHGHGRYSGNRGTLHEHAALIKRQTLKKRSNSTSLPAATSSVLVSDDDTRMGEREFMARLSDYVIATPPEFRAPSRKLARHLFLHAQAVRNRTIVLYLGLASQD